MDGADFAQVAKEKSSCPSKEKGGSLGSFERGRMVPEFEAAAFSQKIGELGPVVKTPFGYHLIRVTGKQEKSTRSLEEASEEIRKHLTSQAKEQLFTAFVETLRKQADISGIQFFDSYIYYRQSNHARDCIGKPQNKLISPKKQHEMGNQISQWGCHS